MMLSPYYLWLLAPSFASTASTPQPLYNNSQTALFSPLTSSSLSSYSPTHFSSSPSSLEELFPWTNSTILTINKTLPRLSFSTASRAFGLQAVGRLMLPPAPASATATASTVSLADDSGSSVAMGKVGGRLSAFNPPLATIIELGMQSWATPSGGDVGPVIRTGGLVRSIEPDSFITESGGSEKEEGTKGIAQRAFKLLPSTTDSPRAFHLVPAETEIVSLSDVAGSGSESSSTSNNGLADTVGLEKPSYIHNDIEAGDGAEDITEAKVGHREIKGQADKWRADNGGIWRTSSGLNTDGDGNGEGDNESTERHPVTSNIVAGGSEACIITSRGMFRQPGPIRVAISFHLM